MAAPSATKDRTRPTGRLVTPFPLSGETANPPDPGAARTKRSPHSRMYMMNSGDVVFVSGAAGGVGSLSHQLGGGADRFPEPDRAAAEARGVELLPFSCHHTPGQVAAWREHFTRNSAWRDGVRASSTKVE